MVKCDYCTEEIDYLPFTCRYCGKSYCKAHRIPENHECSFEFKNDPFKVISLDKTKTTKIYSDYPAESIPRESFSKRERVRPPRIRDRMNRSRPQVTSLLGTQAKPYGTYGLMIANTVFFVIAFILNSIPSVGIEYLYLSVSDYLGKFNYWTIITSIFIPYYPTFFGIFFLLINMLMLFFIGRMIEARWGWKTVLKIYILSGLLASVGTLLIQWISSISASSIASIPYYTSWGAYLGLVTFIALLFPQQQVTMFLYFIPIRVKMKNLVWIFTGISALFGFINLIAIIIGYTAPLGATFPQQFGSVIGALGGLIMNRMLRRNY
jgi:membrane associated rhomboid family serine protease